MLVEEFATYMAQTGLLDIEEDDTAYQDYLSATWGNQDETLDYDDWLAFTQVNIDENKEYDQWFREQEADPWEYGAPEKLRKQAQIRLDGLSMNEWWLRY